METTEKRWIQKIQEENVKFVNKTESGNHPLQRAPCPYAIITCMDPRINLSAVGIPPFLENGETNSQVRIIRTLGGMSDLRSLVVGIHLAGFKEILFLFHTDCGCTVAFAAIDKLIENLYSNLSDPQMITFKKMIGEPFRDKLLTWLKAFEDPKAALIREIKELKKQSFIPGSMVIHGMIYDLSSRRTELVVNGYEDT